MTETVPRARDVSPEPDDAYQVRDKVARLYSEAAPDYEELWAPELLPLTRKLLPHLPLQPARAVFEGGAGVGRLLPELQALAPEATIVAADLSLGMLQRAPRHFPRAVMDLSQLALAAGSIDVAVLAFVLFHLFDPPRGLREVARILRRGGSVGTATWGADEGGKAHDVWAEELAAHGAPPPDPDFARFEAVDSPQKVEAMMIAVGLQPVHLWVGEYRARNDPETFLEHRTRHGQSRLRFESLPDKAREACLQEVRRRLGSLEPADFEESSEIVYAVGRKS